MRTSHAGLEAMNCARERARQIQGSTNSVSAISTMSTATSSVCRNGAVTLLALGHLPETR